MRHPAHYADESEQSCSKMRDPAHNAGENEQGRSKMCDPAHNKVIPQRKHITNA